MWKLNKSSKVLLDDSPEEDEARPRGPPPPPPPAAAFAAPQVGDGDGDGDRDGDGFGGSEPGAARPSGHMSNQFSPAGPWAGTAPAGSRLCRCVRRSLGGGDFWGCSPGWEPQVSCGSIQPAPSASAGRAGGHLHSRPLPGFWGAGCRHGAPDEEQPPQFPAVLPSEAPIAWVSPGAAWPRPLSCLWPQEPRPLLPA